MDVHIKYGRIKVSICTTKHFKPLDCFKHSVLHSFFLLLALRRAQREEIGGGRLNDSFQTDYEVEAGNSPRLRQDYSEL